MATITIKLDFFVCETSINTFLCKFYYWDNSNSRIMPWTAQQSNKQDALALMQTYSNDLYTSLLNVDGITPLGGGSVTDYGTYTEMSFDLVVETGSQSQEIDYTSQSQEIDYTQILTSINSNLATIANKNYQSDIVSCLNNIFTQTYSNGSINSIFKDSNANTDVEKANTNICRLFRSFYYMFNTNTGTGTGNLNNSFVNSVFKSLNDKLSTTFNVNNVSRTSGIADVLSRLFFIFTSTTDYSAPNLSSNSFIKQISDKLANTNDLHTISQAIDLISTAITQTNNTLTNTNSDLGNIATNINSIQSNPLIEVNIDVPYEVKNLTKKDTEY